MTVHYRCEQPGSSCRIFTFARACGGVDTGVNFNRGSNEGNEMQDYAGQEVTIVDIKMPFMSMVVFIVKLVIAAIPAMIILAILGALVGTFMMGLSVR